MIASWFIVCSHSLWWWYMISDGCDDCYAYCNGHGDDVWASIISVWCDCDDDGCDACAWDV